VYRPEVVSAPLAQMFPSKILCPLGKSERMKVESPTLPPPRPTLVASVDKKGEGKGGRKREGLRREQG